MLQPRVIARGDQALDINALKGLRVRIINSGSQGQDLPLPS
jgi:hypothetical protein